MDLIIVVSRAGLTVIITGLADFKAVSVKFGIDFINLIILIISFRTTLISLGAGLITAT